MLSMNIYFKTSENKIYDKKIVANVKVFTKKKKRKKSPEWLKNLGRASFGG